jgi:hypothetical protein
VSGLCDQLSKEYEIDRATHEQKVCTILTEMKEEGLIQIVIEDGD